MAKPGGTGQIKFCFLAYNESLINIRQVKQAKKVKLIDSQ